jgi:P-type E1-E2 ATPase
LLDKTGTLTYGKPQVVSIDAAQGYDPDELLHIAAAAERNSEHPLALAVLAAAQKKQLAVAEPSSFAYTPGKGVRAMVDGHTILVGNTALLKEAGVSLPAMSTVAGAQILVARDNRFIGSIQIADQVRDGAREAIRELQEMGLQIELLTGDTEASAKAVGETLGVVQVSSGLLPEQKSARVDELIRAGRTVTMIGDGINDAPALSHAHAGVAMGSGTEVAHASANVLLIGNDLRKFVETLKTARWCRAVIYQNFYGTLIVDAFGIALAAAGMINPLLAAFIHVSSELTFILNSTRLLPRFSRK